MTRIKIGFIIFSSLITIVLLLVQIQGVQAIGPSFESGSDGFSVREGEILTYNVSNIDPVLFAPVKIGDKYRFIIENIENQNLKGWIADAIWFKKEYWNQSSGNWTITDPYTLYGGYNSTNPAYTEFYFLLQDDPFYIPQNFSAANYTIVHWSIDLEQIPNPSYISPISPNTKGTWSIWNGSWSTSNSRMYNYTYDGKILTQMARLDNGTTGWHYLFELTLINHYIPNGGTDLGPLLLMLANTGEGIGIEILTIIAIVAVIGLIIGIVIIKQIRR